MIATVFLLLYLGFSHHSIGWTMALLPLVIFFQLIAMVGVNFFLSSVSVYVRDLTNIVQVFSTIGLYIMPVFYPSAWMPEFLRPIHYLNPFSYLVWCYQDVMYFGRFEHWWAWCVFPALSLLMLVLGYRTFKTLRTMFANAL